MYEYRSPFGRFTAESSTPSVATVEYRARPVPDQYNQSLTDTEYGNCKEFRHLGGLRQIAPGSGGNNLRSLEVDPGDMRPTGTDTAIQAERNGGCQPGDIRIHAFKI